MKLNRNALHRTGLLAVLALFAIGLTGCATAPAPLKGEFPPFQPEQATERSVGAQVRWGGMLVDTRPGADETCIEILARDLDREARPIASDRAHGRFLACHGEFKDPAVFTSGRELTVVGRMTGFVDGAIGEFEYRYPRVDADVLYLWTTRPEVAYYDPWWYGPRPYYHYPRTRFGGHIIIRR